MDKTEFWTINVTTKTLSWECKFTSQPRLGDVLTALKQENQHGRYVTLIELVEYIINNVTGLSAAPALPRTVEIAGSRIGTLASRIDTAYNNPEIYKA